MKCYEAACDKADLHIYSGRDEWLKERGKGIGGSDAAALVDQSRFKTLQQLWSEKVMGTVNPVKGPQIEYGTNAEEPIRTLFALRHSAACGADDVLEVDYMPDACLCSKALPWMRYSPDGLLFDPVTNTYGILEIKTSMVHNGEKAREWKEGVPIEYYLQILHGLLVTGFSFVILTAELRFWHGKIEIIERRYDREDVQEDLEELLRMEQENWQRYFVAKEMPGLSLAF